MGSDVDRTTALFEADGRAYAYADLIEALGRLGIGRGDTVFVHSDLKSFGKLAPGVGRDQWMGSFIEAFRERLGKEGNLLMPTFTYSYCKKEDYDPGAAPSTVGALTEAFRTYPGVRRTLDPIFSAAALGPDSDYFAAAGSADCFDKDSIFGRLHQKKAKLVFLGNTFDITYLHYAEQQRGVPYRFIKEFTGRTRVDGNWKETTVRYNVRHLDRNVSYNLEGIAGMIDRRGLLSTVPFGAGRLREVSSVNAYNVIREELDRDIHALLKEKPVS
jgi:aminoglycoside 3-N-acetyltransferase